MRSNKDSQYNKETVSILFESLMEHEGWNEVVSQAYADIDSLKHRLAKTKFENLAEVTRLQGEIAGIESIINRVPRTVSRMKEEIVNG